MNLDNFFRTSDNSLIYFEDYAKEKGKPIILVPGYCCTTNFYKNNVTELSKEHRVITFDSRGHGNSSKCLHGHTLQRYCEDLKELIDYLEVKDAILIGWSMAGQIVVNYYHLYQNHGIKALGLIDCPLGACFDEEWNAHGLKGFNMDTFNDHLQMSVADWNGFCTFFSHMMYDGNDDSKVGWCAKELTKTPPWIAYAIYYDYVTTNCFEMLEEITLPMVFFGANDAVTANGKDLCSKYWVEKAKKATYTMSFPFEKGGHVLFDTESAEFNRDLLQFADKVFAKTD